MAKKRQIKVKIEDNGEVKFDNSGNSDEKRILAELAELAKELSGDPKAVKIEKHVHSHGTAHSHQEGEVHSH